MFNADTRGRDRHRSNGALSVDWSDSVILQPMGQDQDAAAVSARLQTGTVKGKVNLKNMSTQSISVVTIKGIAKTNL